MTAIKNILWKWANNLYPIYRTLMGKGVRESLSYIKEELIQLEVKSINSGENVFDWTIPDEWELLDGYIADLDGNKIINIDDNKLHVVVYSQSVNKIISLRELEKKLYSEPNSPAAIPYRTSYYKNDWGFCIAENQRKLFKDEYYKVYINSKHYPGRLDYGECLIKGKSKTEIIISTYICHPSLANNEVSGPVVTMALAKWLYEKEDLYYSYRILFVPETIGSIAYISNNYESIKKNVKYAIIVTCVGDDRNYSILSTPDRTSILASLGLNVIRNYARDYNEYDWRERGSDERQYASPNLRIPTISLMRTKYGEYPEYHTSLDKLNTVVTPDGLYGGYNINRLLIEAIEMNVYPKQLLPCEIFMSKYGLRDSLGGLSSVSQDWKVISDFLFLSDGRNSLVDIADKMMMPIWDLYELVILLEKKKIITLKREMH